MPVAVYKASGGVLHGKTLTQITASGADACALDSTGTAYCWGANGNGQVGDNTVVARNAPVAVTNPSGTLPGLTLTQVTSGANYTCGLDAAGAAYCWGANGNGQLGNDTQNQSLMPVAVLNTSGVLAGQDPDPDHPCQQLHMRAGQQRRRLLLGRRP